MWTSNIALQLFPAKHFKQKSQKDTVRVWFVRFIKKLQQEKKDTERMMLRPELLRSNDKSKSKSK